MTAPPPAPDELEIECDALTRYLAGAGPSGYVLECYRRLRPSADAGIRESTIDRLLVAAARVGPPVTRVADAYARLFRPTGILRRRLTLVLAILENAPPFFGPISAGTAGFPIGVALGVAGQGLLFGLALGAGIIGFGPIHLAARLLGATREGPA